jgi:hypothetical protein
MDSQVALKQKVKETVSRREKFHRHRELGTLWERKDSCHGWGTDKWASIR